MGPKGITASLDIGGGRTISIETGRLAKQADGAVVIKQGNTMLLATVVSNKEAKEGVDFLPLTVEYKEKYAAVGKFPGGFFKREARPSEYEILICRLVDRAMRPLFPDDYHAETQIMISLISADKNILPDALACLAASAAIAVSDIPFNGPVSEVRIARIDGKLVVNPLKDELEKADMDLIVAATSKDIMMVEGELKEASEEDMVEALKVAHDAIKDQCKAQDELAALVEKAKTKREYQHEEPDDLQLQEALKAFCYDRCYNIAKEGNNNKHERSEAFDKVKEDFIATLTEEEVEAKAGLLGKYFHSVEKEAVRQCVLNERVRLDGRKLDEIRPIWTEVDVLPAAHGSSIFTRGETQSLTSVTLGTKYDQQTIDGAMFEGSSKFMLHYNFPSFSTGEAYPNRGTSRREIGHGNLALRALKGMVPDDENNPYTVRVVSDILESNGSSSMATVCAGSMALMDAGVKIRKPVAGIAMGLIADNSGKYAVLSDILGDEDHLGDMDFKVTGTEDGITACQMDIKVDGLSYEVLVEALHQAKAGRLHILEEMSKTINEPKADYKSHVPRIVKITIAKEFIGAVIGPGGKVIQEIQKETGATILIEEVGEFGIVDIVSDDKESLDKAIQRIKAIVTVPEVGEEYEATVKSIMPYGAFMEFLPGKQGLLHISEISWARLESMDGVFKEGDKVKIKLLDIDERTGKFKLSRKAMIPKPDFKKEESAAKEN